MQAGIEAMVAQLSSWVSQKSPRSPDLSHNPTKDILWMMENWSYPPCVKAELAALTQNQAPSGEGCSVNGPPDQEYDRRAELNQAQPAVGHQTGCRGSTCTLTTAFERGARGGVDKNLSDTCWDVRTLCRAGKLKEAPHILNQGGIRADSNTYACILQVCINAKDLAVGKQVHVHLVQSRFKPNIFLLNTLLNMYAKCGSMLDARQLFDEIPARDVSTWNILISGYAKHGCGREAFKIYEQMQWEGVTPNGVTFICILNACSSLGALEKGKEVHADIIKSGLVPDIILETALADMYAKCRSLLDARQVFDNMAKRNVVSWNAMIAGYARHGCGGEAFELYEKMQRDRVTPNKITFICVLNACAILGDLDKGKGVHADILSAGIAPNIVLETALANMYAKCGSMKDAHQVFNCMAKRNVVSWNTMISGYAQHGCGREAFAIFEEMQQERVEPNTVTFTSVFNACAILGALELGKEVHADTIRAGIVPDIILETALADMYARCGSMKDACQVFDSMAQRNVVSFNAMMAGYTQQGCGREAFKIYEQMQREGVTPNSVTFVCALNACASLRDLEKGKEIHADIMKSGFVSNLSVGITVVNMYAKCGSIKDARQVFDNMAERDVVSWTAMMAGYAQQGCDREAFEIYEQMQREGVTPNGITFICVLNVCASLGALQKGKEVHADIMKVGIASNINLENSIVDMYAKCGSLEDARQIFMEMSKRDIVSWNAMIAGCAQHGCGREALQLLEQMEQEGLKPTAITFISLLSACSHVGLVDEGRHYFESMSRDHGLTHDLEHLGCMVDVLGRAGRLEEAEDFINGMPIKPHAGLWRALLGACKTHGNLEVAERVAKSILKSDPQESTDYVARL